jgi:hypothetical protein
MFFILGTIPYMAMGMIMASMGYNYTTWQLWAVLGCMLASDAISTIKTLVNK